MPCLELLVLLVECLMPIVEVAVLLLELLVLLVECPLLCLKVAVLLLELAVLLLNVSCQGVSCSRAAAGMRNFDRTFGPCQAESP